MRSLRALEREMKASGAWVINGPLYPPSTATVVRRQGAEIVMTDGPYTKGKEHIAGFVIVEATDLDVARDCARRLARGGISGGAADRGLSTPFRVAVQAQDVERVFREEFGCAVAVLVRVFGDIASPKKWSRTRSWWRCSIGPPADCLQVRPVGSSPPPQSCDHSSSSRGIAG